MMNFTPEFLPWLAGVSCYGGYRLVTASTAFNKAKAAKVTLCPPQSHGDYEELMEEPSPERHILKDVESGVTNVGVSSQPQARELYKRAICVLVVLCAIPLAPLTHRAGQFKVHMGEQFFAHVSAVDFANMTSKAAQPPAHELGHSSSDAKEARDEKPVVVLLPPQLSRDSFDAHRDPESVQHNASGIDATRDGTQMLDSQQFLPTGNSQSSAGSDTPRDSTQMVESPPLLPTGDAFDPPREFKSVEPALVVGMHRQMLKKGTVGGVTFYKSAYYGDFSIGTPAENYTMLFDTGSGHIILPSTFCHSETCRAHKRYSRVRSTSGRDIDAWGRRIRPHANRDEVVITFGTGEISGVFVDDIVCTENVVRARDSGEGSNETIFGEPTSMLHSGRFPIGGLSQEDLMRIGCTRMRMIAATEMSEMPFKTFQFDGVLGLGLKPLSTRDEFNFAHVMARHLAGLGAVMPHVFAIYLEERKNGHSEIAFGGWSSNRMAGALHWNDVYKPEFGHWLVRIKKMHVDGKEVEFCADGTCKGVADSGTSLLAVPPPAFPEIFEMLRHPAPMDGFCDGRGPNLHIELDHATLTLSPEDYARPEPIKVKRRFLPNIDTEANTTDIRQDVRCKPIFMSLGIDGEVGNKLFILGEPILRKYYTVYDTKGVGNGPRIGFSRAAEPPTSESAAPEDLIDEWFYNTEVLDE